MLPLMSVHPRSASDPYPPSRVSVLDSEMSYVKVGRGDPIVFLHGNPTSLWQSSRMGGLNDENFRLPRRYVSDDMTFEGSLASRQGADAIFVNLERMRPKYDVKKVFVEGDDVCVFYDVTLSGVNVFTCGCYQVEDGKIGSLKLVFDPRPVLAAKAA